MEPRQHGWTDQQVEQVVGNLLRFGVLLSAAVILFGAILYLYQSGSGEPDRRKFKGEPPDLEDIRTIAAGAWALEGKYVIQFGLLLLMATPVARVAFSVFAFAWQRDWLYVAVTLVVLAV